MKKSVNRAYKARQLTADYEDTESGDLRFPATFITSRIVGFNIHCFHYIVQTNNVQNSRWVWARFKLRGTGGFARRR